MSLNRESAHLHNACRSRVEAIMNPQIVDKGEVRLNAAS